MIVSLLLLGLACTSANAFYTLRQLSYTKLPASTRGDFKLFSGTAQEGAYDYKQSILYVVGQSSHLLHVIDIQDPSNPQLLFSHDFTYGEGTPRSVSFCADPNAGTGEIAVALSSVYPDAEGHVQFLHPYQRSAPTTHLLLDGWVVVGHYPDHIKYTPDCGSLVVANKAKPGKDYAGKFSNPNATITIIHGEKTGNPSVKTADFLAYDNRVDIRSPGKSIPRTVLPTPINLVQDLTPECVAISADSKTAYITLQENDAIATVDVSSGVVKSLNPLPRKNWDTIPIDASDRDGGNGKPGIHRRTYTNLRGIRQPSAIRTLTIGRNNFLFTADEGHTRYYTKALHTFDWSDDSLARTLAPSIDTFSTDQAFRTNAGNDEYLGRLHVSKIDGLDLRTSKYTHLEAFGGRGFSVWDPSDLTSPVFDSAGALEEYMEAFDRSVFNSDCVGSSAASYQSPENLRDSVSDNMGPKINALDVAEDNGTTYLVVGSEPTGFLFIYTVDVSSSVPVPQFQGVVRSGMKDLPWADLFLNGTAAGDGYIADIGIITSDKSPIDRPLVYVISDGTGSVSLYELENQTPTIPVGRKR